MWVWFSQHLSGQIKVRLFQNCVKFNLTLKSEIKTQIKSFRCPLNLKKVSIDSIWKYFCRVEDTIGRLAPVKSHSVLNSNRKNHKRAHPDSEDTCSATGACTVNLIQLRDTYVKKRQKCGKRKFCKEFYNELKINNKITKSFALYNKILVSCNWSGCGLFLFKVW